MSTSVKINPKTSFFYVILVSSLTAILAKVTIDFYLPSLPSIEKSLQATTQLTQLSITMFALGALFFQIPSGIIIDKFGVKTGLVFALLAFFILALISAFSGNIIEMIVFRFLQGICIAFVTVSFKAIPAASLDRLELSKALTIVMPIASLSPALSPLLGGYIDYYYGWQMVFFAMAALALILVFIVLFLKTPEADKKYQPFKKKNNDLFGLRGIFWVCKNLFSNLKIVEAFLTISFGNIIYWLYVSATPLFGKLMGLNSKEIGFMYLPVIAPFAVSALITGKILNQSNTSKIYSFGVTVLISAIVLLYVLDQIFHLNAYQIFSFVGLMTLGLGFSLPTASGLILSYDRENSGTISAISGMVTTSSIVIGSYIVSHLSNTMTPYNFADLCFTIVCLYIGFLILIKFAAFLKRVKKSQKSES